MKYISTFAASIDERGTDSFFSFHIWHFSSCKKYIDLYISANCFRPVLIHIHIYKLDSIPCQVPYFTSVNSSASMVCSIIIRSEIENLFYLDTLSALFYIIFIFHLSFSRESNYILM